MVDAIMTYLHFLAALPFISTFFIYCTSTVRRHSQITIDIARPLYTPIISLSATIAAAMDGRNVALCASSHQRRIDQWIFLDVPSDITLAVNGECFSLHKVHNDLSDSERKRLCKLVDFRKLSEETNSHASRNERLPLQTTVQILFIEQMRLRSALNCSYRDDNWDISQQSLCAPSETFSPPDNYASLRRENRELKLELSRMHARLNDLERGHSYMKHDLKNSSSQKLLNSIARKIGNLSLFGRPYKGASLSSKNSQKSGSSSIAGRRA